MQTEPDNLGDKPESLRHRTVVSEPDFNRPIKPIGQLLSGPDFPKSALGEFVDIGGYTGVVTEIVNQSLKVRSPEGATKSFNVGGLRRIYGPVLRPQSIPDTRETTPPPPADRPVLHESPAKPVVLPAPDFGKPVKKIVEFVKRPDYPVCLLGEHVEIGDYTGVVVQIINHSLKVRSQAETTRSYNADTLRKLHG